MFRLVSTQEPDKILGSANESRLFYCLTHSDPVPCEVLKGGEWVYLSSVLAIPYECEGDRCCANY